MNTTPKKCNTEATARETDAPTRQDIRIPVMMQGTRLKLELWIGVGPNQPCTLKSVAIGYELQGSSL